MKLKAKEKVPWEKYLPHSKRNQGSISKAHVEAKCKNTCLF